jgi:hypothetical protein
MWSFLCCLGKKRQWEQANENEDVADTSSREVKSKTEEDEVSQSSNVSSVARSMLFMPLL